MKESGPENSWNTAAEMVEKLIDTVIAHDSRGWSELGSPLSNTYWISEGNVQIYHRLFRPDVIEISRTSTTAPPKSRFATGTDAIVGQMVAPGQHNRPVR